MRVGLKRYRGKESLNKWFFHTIGSGIYFDSRGMTFQKVVYLEQTVPRRELVFRGHYNVYWPDYKRFTHFNGKVCDMDFSIVEITYCKSSELSIWNAYDDNICWLQNPPPAKPPSPLHPPTPPATPPSPSLPRRGVHPLAGMAAIFGGVIVIMCTIGVVSCIRRCSKIMYSNSFVEMTHV